MTYDVKAYRKKTGTYKQIPANKIIAWIERNFEYKTRKNGAEYRINSPFEPDTGYNFNINPEHGVCHDWRSNEWAGAINPETGKRNCSFIKFVRLYKKYTYHEAIRDVLGASEDVSEFLKPTGRVTDGEAKRKVSVALPDGVEMLAGASDKQAMALKVWLRSRGYTNEDIEKYELHYLGMDVYWPYYEFDTLVYYQSRSRLNKKFNFPAAEIKDEDGKVIGVTDGSKSDFFYGFDEVKPASYVVITEAIFDQYTLGEQALASGGAILTKQQIGKLRILGPRDGVILAPDNDIAGVKSILYNYDLLQGMNSAIWYSLPPQKTHGVKDWNELIEKMRLSKSEVLKQFEAGLTRIRHNSDLAKLRDYLRELEQAR